MQDDARPTIIGREIQLDSIRARLADEEHRVVTLRGPGGVGKTTLARRITREREAPFVGLEVCTNIDEIASAVGETLGVPDRSRNVSGLAERIDDVPLVVLDNAEHVLDAVAEVLAAWPTRFLVTSRYPTGVDGETVLDIGPLGVDEAVELFEMRARDVAPEFVLDDSNRDDALRLVELVDRLPLAVELAAARTALMTPRQVLERLNAHFDVLRDRGAPIDRHATLDGCVEWSWDLLDDRQRDVLRQLSLFRGPFELDEAEEIVATEGWVGDAIEELLERSMVRSGRTDHGIFFSLYDGVRRFVDRHSSPDDALVERYAAFLIGRAQAGPLGHRDRANIVHAFELAIDRRPTIATELLVETRSRLWRSGFADRVLQMLERVLRVDELDPMWKGATHAALAASHYATMDFEATDRALDAAAELVQGDDRPVALRTRARIALLRGVRADADLRLDEADAFYAEGRTYLEALGPDGRANMLAACGIAELRRGHAQQAVADFEGSIRAARQGPDQGLVARALGWSANGYLASGQTDRAIARLEETLEIYAEIDDVTPRAAAEYGLAQALSDREPGRALDMARRSLVTARKSGVRLLNMMATVLVARLRADETSAEAIQRQLQLFGEASSQGERWSAWLSLIVVLFRTGDFERAARQAELFITAVSTDAERRWGRRYLAVIRAADGEPGGACELVSPAFGGALQRALERGHVADDDLAEFDDPYMRYMHDQNPLHLSLLDEFLQASKKDLRLLDDGDRVVLPDGTEVDLQGRYVLKRLFLGLCRASDDRPGSEMTMEELIEVGWPDQTMTYESGMRRVYSSIRNLRKLGLEQLILTAEDGYLLDPEVAIAWGTFEPR